MISLARRGRNILRPTLTRLCASAPQIPLDEIRTSVARFAASEITPHASAIDSAGRIPDSLWRSLGSLGLLGVTAPTTHGGLGLGYAAHCAVMEELSRASASVGLSYGAHSNLCVSQIARHGTEGQQNRWLPGLLSGEAVGALAMSEAGAGSDVVSMRSVAKRKKNGYELTGGKMWITNGPSADVFVVYAKTPADGQAAEEAPITAFVLEKGMTGFSTSQKLDKLGMRGSETCELVFEGVQLGPENILGEPDKGVYVLMSGLDSERLVLSAGPLGIMRACMDVVLPYVRERRQFGRPIGEFQLMQGKIADMYTTTEATAAFVGETARNVDAGRAGRKECAAVILYAAENATRVALEAVQALGGNGYVEEYPAARLLRDAKLYEIGAGTSEVRRMLIGRELFREE